MSAPTFDTHAALSDLRSAGIEEPAAETIVDVVSAATSPLVTRDMLTTEIAGLRADMLAAMHRALWFQALGIVTVVGGIVGIAEVIG